MEMERRLTTVENWQASHEQACTARWDLLLKVIGWGGGVAASAMIVVAGWSLAQIHSDQQEQVKMLQQLVQHR